MDFVVSLMSRDSCVDQYHCAVIGSSYIIVALMSGCGWRNRKTSVILFTKKLFNRPFSVTDNTLNTVGNNTTITMWSPTVVLFRLVCC